MSIVSNTCEQPYGDTLVPTNVVQPAWSMESVYLPCIRAMICPEIYCSRLSTVTTAKSAVTRYTQLYTIVPNALGNAGVMLNADSIPSANFGNVYAGSDFIPSSGIGTATASLSTDLSTSGAVAKGRCVGFCASMFAVATMINLAGTIEAAYFDSNGSIGATSAGPNATRASMTTQLSYQAKSARERVRATHNSGYEASTQMGTPPIFGALQNDFIYFLITGAVATTFTLVVDYVYEYIPNPAFLPIVEMSLSVIAPATVPVFVSAISQHPAFLTMSRAEAISFCESFPLGIDFSTYNHVLRHFQACAGSLASIEILQIADVINAEDSYLVDDD
jgi:hypothetical protein